MSDLLFEFKPNYVNALGPLIAKFTFYSFIITFVSHLIIEVLKNFDIIKPTFNTYIFDAIIFFAIIIIKILTEAVILFNTRYLFYRTHIKKEFEFITLRSNSVPYDQINSVHLNISLWDQISKSGDIKITTADDGQKDLILHYVKEPKKIEEKIYHIIGLNKKAN